jgi:hypothetical protein
MVAPVRTYVREGHRTSVETGTVPGVARVVVEDGAYAGVAAWNSRVEFVDVVELGVRTIFAGYLRRENKDSTTADSFCRWLRREAAGADHATGRGMRESVATIAADLGCSTSLVRRCRRIARAMGIYRDIVYGRLLRLSERLEIHPHGSNQRGVTGERAFTIPKALLPLLSKITRRKPRRSKTRRRRQTVDSETHPRGRLLRPDSYSGNNSTTAQNGKSEKEGRFATPSIDKERRRSARELARAVAKLLKLGPRVPLNGVTPHFERFVDHNWTPEQIHAAIKRTGISTNRAIRKPAGWLSHLLRHVDATAYEPTEPTPARPDWCGHCVEDSRRLEDPVTRADAGRCPTCHPLSVDTYASTVTATP